MSDLYYKTADRTRFSAQKMQKVNLFESPRMFCDLYCLEPGQEQITHAHGENDKVYHVLEGICTVQIGSETRELAAGEGAVAPAGVEHGVVNRSGGRVVLLVMMAPHPRLRA